MAAARRGPGRGACVLGGLILVAAACSTSLDELSTNQGARTVADAGSPDAPSAPDAGRWACTVSQKRCGDVCTEIDDPLTGCDSDSCSACLLARATPTCAGGCAIDSCDAGFGDCDGQVENGCETDLKTDPGSCGACNTACAAAEVCSQGSCEALCGAGLTNCSSACADLSTDSENCGACGKSCLGGACLLGKCQPAVLASGEPNPASIAIAGGAIYWANDSSAGQIKKLDLGATAAPTVVASDLDRPKEIFASNGHLYWREAAAIRRVSLSGGPIEELYAGASVTSLAVGAHVYFGTSAGALYRIALDGGEKEPLFQHTSPSVPEGVAVGASQLFWQQYKVAYRLPLAGGEATAIASAVLPTGAGTAVGDEYYFGLITQLWRWDGSPLALSSDEKGPSAIAHDAGGLYWVNRGGAAGTGTVRHLAAPITQSSPVTLATGQDEPVAIQTDADAVYWASSGSGEIVRLLK